MTNQWSSNADGYGNFSLAEEYVRARHCVEALSERADVRAGDVCTVPNNVLRCPAGGPMKRHHLVHGVREPGVYLFRCDQVQRAHEPPVSPVRKTDARHGQGVGTCHRTTTVTLIRTVVGDISPPAARCAGG